MKTILPALMVSLLVTLGGVSVAADKKPAKPAAAKAAGKEVTLKGTLGCGKCAFHESKKCENVLKVTEGGKETKYYLAQNSVAEENHEMICKSPKAVTVTGTVADES